MNEPEMTLAAFLAEHDPRASAFWQRQTWTPDLPLALSVGELIALRDLIEIVNQHKGDCSIERAIGIFLAGRTALHRRRDALAFPRVLAEHAIDSPEVREHRLTEFEDILAGMREERDRTPDDLGLAVNVRILEDRIARERQALGQQHSFCADDERHEGESDDAA